MTNQEKTPDNKQKQEKVPSSQEAIKRVDEYTDIEEKIRKLREQQAALGLPTEDSEKQKQPAQDSKQKSEILFKLGETAFSEKNFQDSMKYFEEALKYCAENDRDRKWNILYKMAYVYGRIGEFDKIEECLNAILAFQKDKVKRAQILYHFGNLYWNQFSKPLEAITHFEGSLEGLPESLEADCLNNLACCYHSVGNKDEALQLLEEFDEANKTPQNPLIKFNLGIFNLRDGKSPQKAISYFQEFITISDDPELRVNSLLGLARAYITLREEQKAIEYLIEANKQCKKLEQGNEMSKAELLNKIGVFFHELGQHQDALNCFQEALSFLAKIDSDKTKELRTNIIHFARNKGLSAILDKQKQHIAELIKQGEDFLSANQFNEAIQLYAKALEIAQSTSDQQTEKNLLADLGWAYFLRGDIARALICYKLVIPKENPNFKISIESSRSLVFPGSDCHFPQRGSISEHEKQEMEKAGKTNNTVFFDKLGNYLNFEAVIGNRTTQTYPVHISMLEGLAGGTEENEKRSEIRYLVRTGLAYLENLRHETAIEYLEKALFAFRFSEEASHKQLYIAFILGHLGKAQANLNNDAEAIKNLEEALAINTEQENIVDKCENLLFLSELHGKQENPEKAIRCLKELLREIQKEQSASWEIKYLRQLLVEQYPPAEIAFVLTKLGNAYCNGQHWEEAQKHYQQAQAVYEEENDEQKVAQIQTILDLHQTIIINEEKTGNAQWHGGSLDKLREAHQNLGNLHAARECAKQLLDISQESGHTQDQINDMKKLGIVYAGLKDEDKAQKLFEEALELSRKIDASHEETNLLMELSRLSIFGNMDKSIELKQVALAICEQNQDLEQKASVLFNLGNAYFQEKNLEQAIESYEQALSLFRENDDQTGEKIVLNGMKKVFLYLYTEEEIWQKVSSDLSEYRLTKESEDSRKEKVLSACKSGLLKSQIEANPKMEIICLTKLGGAYLEMGNVKQANSHYQAILPISTTIGDKESEEQAKKLLSCNNLLLTVQEGNAEQAISETDCVKTADVYFEFGLLQPAIECYKYALSFDSKNLTTLKKLTSAYRETYDEEKEKQCNLQLLRVCRERGEKNDELICLERLGDLEDMHNPEKALQYNTEALVLGRELQDQAKECKLLFALGENSQLLGQHPEALEYFEQALEQSRKIGDVNTEINSLFNLAQCHSFLNQNEKALEYFAQTFWRNTKSGDIDRNYSLYEQLENLFIESTQVQPEILHYQKLLEISQEMGNKQAEAMLLIRLGKTYKKSGQLEKAIEYYESGLNQIDPKTQNGILQDIFKDYANVLRSSGETEKANQYNEKENKIRTAEKSPYLRQIYFSSAISKLKDLRETEEIQEANEILKETLLYCDTQESKILREQIHAIMEHNEKLLVIWKYIKNKDYSKLQIDERNLFALAGFYIENDIIEPALKCYEYLLSSESGLDSFSKSELYYNLGVCYSADMLKEKEATTFFERALKSATKENGRGIICQSLCKLSQKHWKEDHPEEAIRLLRNSLYLAQEAKDTEKIYSIYGNLAQVYSVLLNSEKAIEYYKARLKISKKNRNNAETKDNLSNLGKAYSDMENWQKAVEYFEKQIKVGVFKNGQELNSYAALGGAYYNWSRNSKWQKTIKQRRDKAEECFLRQLLGTVALEDRLQEASAWTNLAVVQEESEKRIEYLIQACACINETQKGEGYFDRVKQKAFCLDSLGTAYYEIENFEYAFNVYQAAYQLNKQSPTLEEDKYEIACQKAHNLVNLVKTCFGIGNAAEGQYIQEMLDLLHGYPFRIEIDGFISEINGIYSGENANADQIIEYVQNILTSFESFLEDMKASDLTLDNS